MHSIGCQHAVIKRGFRSGQRATPDANCHIRCPTLNSSLSKHVFPIQTGVIVSVGVRVMCSECRRMSKGQRSFVRSQQVHTSALPPPPLHRSRAHVHVNPMCTPHKRHVLSLPPPHFSSARRSALLPLFCVPPSFWLQRRRCSGRITFDSHAT